MKTQLVIGMQHRECGSAVIRVTRDDDTVWLRCWQCDAHTRDLPVATGFIAPIPTVSAWPLGKPLGRIRVEIV